MTNGWVLAPGESIKRVTLHDQFGGSRFGGISPSTRTPNVFIFSDPKSGEKHGYIDDWKDDGCFHYTGEGQQGDQRMAVGKRAIAEADQVGRALRVFKGTGGTVQYEGQFELDKLRLSIEPMRLKPGSSRCAQSSCFVCVRSIPRPKRLAERRRLKSGLASPAGVMRSRETVWPR